MMNVPKTSNDILKSQQGIIKNPQMLRFIPKRRVTTTSTLSSKHEVAPYRDIIRLNLSKLDNIGISAAKNMDTNTFQTKVSAAFSKPLDLNMKIPSKVITSCTDAKCNSSSNSSSSIHVAGISIAINHSCISKNKQDAPSIQIPQIPKLNSTIVLNSSTTTEGNLKSMSNVSTSFINPSRNSISQTFSFEMHSSTSASTLYSSQSVHSGMYFFFLHTFLQITRILMTYTL